MRPLAVLVFLLLPEHAERLAAEWAPLARAMALFTVLAAASAASFYGSLRLTRWRRPVYAVLVGLIALAIWIYRPQGGG
jgi:hypothetical protein